jgi:hypothetical protein
MTALSFYDGKASEFQKALSIRFPIINFCVLTYEEYEEDQGRSPQAYDFIIRATIKTNDYEFRYGHRIALSDQRFQWHEIIEGVGREIVRLVASGLLRDTTTVLFHRN